MIKAQRQRLLPLLLLNLLLLVILFLVLNHFGIISWRDMFKMGKKTLEQEGQIIEDPFLLEKEEIKKQWQVLEEKERLYKEKNDELSKKEQVLEEKLKEADNQIAIAKDMQKKQEDLKKQFEDRKANINAIAIKIGNMPPKESVPLLEKMEPTLAVEVIKRMDAIALETGKKTITDFLLSQMNKDKSTEIFRLMSKYPKEPLEEKPNISEEKKGTQ